MIRLSNEKLTVSIAEKGAEIQSILRNDTNLEYMWSGNPDFWGKKSPVLFPIVGGLLGNKYTYNGNEYTLGRHGFARDMNFVVTEQGPDSVLFSLIDNEDTLKVYPFHFIFSIRYVLEENTLSVTYHVKNTGDDSMYFSVGAHPAFRVPLAEGSSFTDYYLEFNQPENAGKWPLSAGGQIETTPVPFLQNTNKLPLHKPLFYEDALVFKNLASNKISIKSDLTIYGLTVQFDGFPYMGIWSAKDADFVCIEPWCGIADAVNANGQLSDKEGMNALHPGQLFDRTWSVTVY
ncbi:aldose 1-epimerase family protein [Chitinophaga sp. sic0106]|uniref:aldose 1-epimerase family protein n=1 Tax=Chitinophaga sp. sic0106 TaxID=2854785 RepID=UPI001C4838EA|nr:aldose 1-epimerase family protein [Chitinophaga sp. sic0106]MBV7531445.1 aldose 1-epimerase family protein [Chitinophaga sp. sic0106]